MGHRGHREGRSRGWAPNDDEQGFGNPWERREQRGERGGRSRGEWGGGWGGPPWAQHGRGGHGGTGGPPPWMAGLFGGPERGRGPRVRRGDVRVAILDVLYAAARAEEPVNGYQVIQQIAERSNDAWRPSPGSVYPTISQLEDEGLVETDAERGRKALRLTAAGTTYAEEHADELAAVWAPFAESTRNEDRAAGERIDLKPEIGQMMAAVWQIVSGGSEAQRRAAVDILVDTRRRLYGVLADGPDGQDGQDETEASRR